MLRTLIHLQLLAFAFTGLASAEIPHRWSDAAKEAVGTAYGQGSSKVWFTIGHGVINEVYYPRIDRAQIGDSQLLFSNISADVPFLEEKRDFTHEVTHPPGIPRTVIRSSWHKQIEFIKEVFTDPEHAALHVHYRFTALPKGAKIYLLHKPTIDNDGAGDVGRIVRAQNKQVFVAYDKQAQSSAYQAVISDAAFGDTSVGIVGESDAWQDLKKNGRMTQQIQSNGPANIAFAAELLPKQNQKTEFEILVGFGASGEEALGAAITSMTAGTKNVRAAFDHGWQSYHDMLAQAPWLADLDDRLARDLLWNATVIKSHEDKTNPGAIIASLSIPNLPAGEGPGDGKNTGGYHLVWTRDLFKSALALLRLGDVRTAVNVLKFMSRMEHNGRMSQNTWVDARPFWTGEQMDQEAFPVLLAFELKRAGVKLDDELESFIARRVARLQRSSGRTGQERWEEVSGFSPNTLAVMSAALSRAGDQEGAKRILNVALAKTVSRHGPLSDNPYFIRITQTGEPDAGEILQIANGGPAIAEYRVLDGGFLEWLRWFPNAKKYFGEAGEELLRTIQNTLPLYDDPDNDAGGTYRGFPLYRRYTGDAYGLNHRGGPWPILTLERALPELQTNPKLALKLLAKTRALWGPGDLCPEQLDRDLKPMPYGASPLVWCHAEMVELAYKAAGAVLKMKNFE